jgi:ergothioneine biosynthesis protein EgtB
MTSRENETLACNAETSAVDQLEHYCKVRERSQRFSEALEPEDCVIQSMPDVSPTRWHLAHTTWFFETFVLSKSGNGYRPFGARFEYLFNSYYNTIGEQYPRSRRGLLSRPTVREILEYRAHVDHSMEELLRRGSADAEILAVIELGLHHEEQHLELMYTDIKHVLFQNPLLPAYRSGREWQATETQSLGWRECTEGLRWIGQEGEAFGFDNERPRHRVFLESYSLGNRLVTCGEYAAFIEEDGYRRPDLWLSEGWERVQEKGWGAPLYWRWIDGQWSVFTLAGERKLQPSEPVCHVSYFEADAFARWSGARIPTEAEWEVVAETEPLHGNLLEEDRLHPRGSVERQQQIAQIYGDTWEWTAAPYSAYPGYVPAEGALGEYNGKFMCNQYVLRGGSCVTPRNHIRATYRNFFPPDARWQFSGIRLAR